jgi:SAM-dependent methyltransferase
MCKHKHKEEEKMDTLASHQYSLKTLSILEKYQDWMDGIKNVAVMGAGAGLDAVWWAELCNRDNVSYGIKVTAVEMYPDVNIMRSHPNIKWIYTDFSQVELPEQDLIWCHNSFQYSLNPLGTLINWHRILKPDGCLCIQVPYRLGVNQANDTNKVNLVVEPGVYFVHTLSNLILQLAATGFDCRDAHFQLDKQNGWINLVVYKTTNAPNYTNNLYDLKNSMRLPACLDEIIESKGFFEETDLILQWLDRSVQILAV